MHDQLRSEGRRFKSQGQQTDVTDGPLCQAPNPSSKGPTRWLTQHCDSQACSHLSVSLMENAIKYSLALLYLFILIPGRVSVCQICVAIATIIPGIWDVPLAVAGGGACMELGCWCPSCYIRASCPLFEERSSPVVLSAGPGGDYPH